MNLKDRRQLLVTGVSKLLRDEPQLTELGDAEIGARQTLISILTDIDNKYVATCSDNETHLSYREGKEYNNSGDRRSTKIGRYIGKVAKPFIPTESDRESLSNKLIAMLFPPASYDIVSGDELMDAFRHKYGEHTCMTGPSRQELLTLFEENSEKIELLKFGDRGKTARALIWHTDCGKRLLDRIYPNSGAHIERIRKWCRESGIWYRIHNGLPTTNTSSGGYVFPQS